MLSVRRQPFSTLEQLRMSVMEHGSVPVTRMTIGNYLRRMGIKCRVARCKPLLTRFQRARRVLWAKSLLNKPMRFWTTCLFSDECAIDLLDGSNQKVFRKDGEENLPQHILPTVKHCPSVTVWGCFSEKGVGQLRILPPNTHMNSKWYIGVLENEVKGSLLTRFRSLKKCCFQDDGAPCHRSKVVVKRRQELGITALEWPGQSPDCNPIENMWRYLKLRVRSMDPKTIPELKEAISHVWHNQISPEYCQALCTSVPRRLRNVIRNHGFATKY